MAENMMADANSSSMATSQALQQVSSFKRSIPQLCSSIQDTLGRIGVAVKSMAFGNEDPSRVELADSLVTLQDQLAAACDGYKKVVVQITNNPWVEDRIKYDVELKKFLQMASETEAQHRQSIMSNPNLLSPVDSRPVENPWAANDAVSHVPAIPRSPGFAEAIPRFEGDMVDYFEWKKALENLLVRRPKMAFLKGYLLRNGLSGALRESVGAPRCLHRNFSSIMALVHKFYASPYVAVSASVRTLLDRVNPDDSNSFLAHRFLNYVKGISDMRHHFANGSDFVDHLLLGLYECKLPDHLSSRWDAFIVKSQGSSSFPTLALFQEFAESLRDEAVQRSSFPRPSYKDP